MKLLGIEESALLSEGGIHTAREISQQPEVWDSVYRLILEQAPSIKAFLNEVAPSVTKMILTGAGTSAFIGMSLAAEYRRRLGRHAVAVPTTDLVTHPGDHFFHEDHILLISFARSGNSPESVAAVSLAERLAGKVFHLVITCDASGALASIIRPDRGHVVVLPPETNDRSLAMTSSYTSMLLAGLLTARIDDLEAEASGVGRLIAAGERVLGEFAVPLLRVAGLDFNRAVVLGSGPQLGTATESHLKLTELTDGQVMGKADSFLGFRHGPKAVTNASTLVLYLFSGLEYARLYECDLVESMETGKHPMYQIGVTALPDQLKGGRLDMEICLSDEAPGLDEQYMAIVSVLPAQMLGFFKSRELGLDPDKPSRSGAISRVVEGVKIYEHD